MKLRQANKILNSGKRPWVSIRKGSLSIAAGIVIRRDARYPRTCFYCGEFGRGPCYCGPSRRNDPGDGPADRTGFALGL